MKTRVSSRKSHYVKGAGILVLVAALIAGMVGCPANGVQQYSLTISSSEGGLVTTPGEDTFTYEEGAVVRLVAEAEEGYQFVKWSGDVGTVADPEAAETTVTMNGNYSITASFQAVSDVVPVSDWYDMDSIRNDLAGHYVLMNDLDSASPGYEELASASANEGKGWEPIGAYDEDDPDRAFTGYFDGQGYEIRGLFIDRPDEKGVGLFGFVHEGAVIKGIGVVNGDVTGREHVGGLLGVNWGTLSNCYSSGSVSGELRVGGLVGRNEGGTVSHCYSSATVAGEQAVAGLVGQNLHDGTVSDSFSSATVVGGWQYIGGLVGSNYYATVSNSHYNYDEVLISGRNIITTGALFREDFEEWLANDKFLDVDQRLSREEGYYLIDDVSGLKELLAFGQDGSLKFRLQNDLDLANEPDFFIPYLAGEFDGDGHKIWNLSFNIDFVSQVGLFGHVAIGGKVTRLGAENVDITGARSVGGLVGANQGTVSNCYSTGVLRNTRQVGGLVGGNGGTITSSYSTASVSGLHLVGGLVGGNVAIVSGCHATGDVTGDDASVGGLVGGSSGTISDSYFAGSVTGRRWVGGLVGRSTGTVSNSYSEGSVTGELFAVGGLVGGTDEGTVSSSYSTGSVTGPIDVGGLVGWNWVATVSDSYATGIVTRSSPADSGVDPASPNVGGFVGRNSRGQITNCYSTGSVHYQGVDDPTDKGFAGSVDTDGDYQMTGNFWDTEASGQSSTAGEATGKTTAEMMDIATFTNTDTEGLDEPWDMTGVASGETNPAYIWNIVNGQTYPFLSWESVG